MQIPEADNLSANPPMSAHKLCFIGASARAAAQSAARDGFDICAIDLFGDRDLVDLCESWLPLDDFWTVEDQLGEMSPSASVIFLGGCESAAALIHSISKKHQVLGATHSQYLKLRDPFWLDRIVLGSAIRRPQRCHARPTDAGAWLYKKLNSTGGLGVFDFTMVNKTQDNEGYFERHVVGRSFGISFLAACNRVDLIGVAASLRSRRVPKRFQYEGSIGPIALPAEMVKELVMLGNRIAANTGLLGLFGIDVIIDTQHTIWLLEINPRWTASMELFDTDTNSLICKHVEACEGRFVASLRQSAGSKGKRVLYATATIYFEYESLRKLIPASIRIADVPANGSKIPAGQPICTLLASGEDPVDVAKLLADQISRINARI